MSALSIAVLALSMTPIATESGVTTGPSSAARFVPPTVHHGRTALTDHAPLARMAIGEEVRFDGVALGDGRSADLVLERFDVLAPDATLIAGTPEGEVTMARPDVVLLRGSIEGERGSRVFLAIGPDATNGIIRRGGGERTFVSTGGGELSVTRAADLAEPAPFQCGVDETSLHLFPNGVAPVVDTSDMPSPDLLGTGTPPCRRALIAVDTDYEFGQLFSGNIYLTANYAVSLMGAVSQIYEEELNVRFELSFLRVWSFNGDPYTTDNADLLGQLRNHWLAEQGSVERVTTHFLSGRTDPSYGGVAWLSALCTPNGFGVSAQLNGSFPNPLVENSSGNWDVVVAAHELGHNFGTLHTHDGYTPTIDDCGNDDCTGAENGTIMSYCHTCPGGIFNVALDFHPRVEQQILNYLDSACDFTATTAAALPDMARTFLENRVTVDVLLNDQAASCEAVVLAIEAFDETSVAGGEVIELSTTTVAPRPQLSYRPPAGFTGTDTFTYTTLGQTATVTIDVDPLLAPVTFGASEPGAAASYFVLSSPSVLPDFEARTPYAEDVVPDVNFESTGGAFATSGRADQVGAVFEGFVEVPEDGVYTFFTNSDDGSALYIGDVHVVDNDGLHGMVEQGGAVALAAGTHPLRVEFFENGGGAGLIVSWAGPSLPKQPIAASAWRHAVPCGEDLSGNGQIDFPDLLAVLAAWGACDGCPEDLDVSGAVDFSDLLAILAAWGECTP